MELIEGAMASPAIYAVIFVLAMLDAVLPAVPSETVVIAAAVFAVSGVPSLSLIILLAAVGAFVGDHLGYGLGRWWLRNGRGGGRLGWAADRMASHLHRRGGALIIAGRFVPGGRTAVVTGAGATGYPLARFSGFAAVAAALWATYSGIIGYLGGAAFESNPAMGLVAGLGVALGVALLGELIRRRPSKRPVAPEPATPGVPELTRQGSA
ncbi:VTT domain-containing protein [Actinoplanes sp. TRM 88003]|uniref:VTT domain-containing protein n=2 Tax=Paractinoplanes aksuensis TaxID=2939490 RepID=A0ABT1E1C4_9ACTN|nr:VTT domain-containing protein [Actinoplanes aksuensis]